MEPVLQISGLTKRFGRILAVDSLDLEIHKGQVFGILGPNGSGKTTTLGMLLGVTKKTAGTYSWFGQGEGNHLRKRVGAILEHPIFYPFLNAVENLRVTGMIKDVRQDRSEELLHMVGLYDRRNDPFKTYSLGMKQRLAIAASMLADPEVLIFDEPTNGLDPQGIADIRKLIIQISELGKTIVLASHLLDEVQKVCSHFAVLREGKKIFTGSVQEALEEKNKVEVASSDLEALKISLRQYAAIKDIDQENGRLIGHSDDPIATEDLNRFLIDRGHVVTHLVRLQSNLEEQFLAILSEGNDEGS